MVRAGLAGSSKDNQNTAETAPTNLSQSHFSDGLSLFFLSFVSLFLWGSFIKKNTLFDEKK
jgi:hypothetical protein